MSSEAPTVGLRRGTFLFLSGGGLRAACFHLGALTRLNELGLLAGTETIRAVGGSSIVAALLAARVRWPLNGAYRDWPEVVAEPMREIARSKIAARMLLRGSLAGPNGQAALEERFARELVGSREPGSPDGPRLAIGAAGLSLGRMDVAGRREPGIRWELEPESPVAGYDPDLIAAAIRLVRPGLFPLPAGAVGVFENHGYLLADASLRAQRRVSVPIEPLTPAPPHPDWMSATRVRERFASEARRRTLPFRPGWTRRTQRHSEPSAGGLLERHRPFVQYDSLESYRADSVATIVELSIDGRCNALHRGDGTPIAAVLPSRGIARLDLGYLGRSTYADGRTVRHDDYLDEAGGSHASDALIARQRDGNADVVYGRAVRGEGRLWLQYWLFFYYNDKGLLKEWRHEGDWEMVQLRIGEDGVPDAVVCGQHAGAERAEWREVERQRTAVGEAAVVYCARGSHALRLRAGTHAAPVVPDHNDGLGPRLRPRLVEIGENGPGWALWPGRWGSTRRREAFEGDSPRGPGEHWQWRNPGEFFREARPIGEAAAWKEPAPLPARFGAYLDGGRPILSYRFPDRPGETPPPARIVAGAYGADDGAGILANSFLIEARGGSCVLPMPSGPPRGIRTSVCSELGTPGETLTVPIER